MSSIVVALLCISCTLAHVTAQPAATQVTHANVTNFVLVGSTGDLSRKYLWEALFIGYVEETFDTNIRIYGAATRPVEEGTSIINGYIANLHCKDSWSSSQCSEGMSNFRRVIEYVQLKTEDHFRSLQETLSNHPEDVHEVLRVFYLSVSPSLYDGLASSINQFVRPSSSSTELRVVFEKPFGRDLQSARELSHRLGRHLQEEEIFRVDHYLGKVGMKAIIEFRKKNLDILQSLDMPVGAGLQSSRNINTEVLGDGDIKRMDEMSQKSPAEVTVVMKEMEDTAGRSGYYDEYGVIRDVFQNHLTQAVVYSLMRLDPHGSNTFGELHDRLAVLTQLKYDKFYSGSDNCVVVSPDQASARLWLGQYDNYREHLKDDHIESKKRRDKNAHIDPEEVAQVQASITPTAAEVLFNLAHSSSEVAVKIWGGKALNTREMVVSVTRSPVRATSCTLIFGIQGTPIPYMSLNNSTHPTVTSGPFILMKGDCWGEDIPGLSPISLPDGWEIDGNHCSNDIRSRIVEQPILDVHLLAAAPQKTECLCRPIQYDSATTPEPDEIPRTTKYLNNAYVQIIEALMTNDRSYFTTTDELHSQWRMWDPVLQDAACAKHSPGSRDHMLADASSEISIRSYPKLATTFV